MKRNKRRISLTLQIGISLAGIFALLVPAGIINAQSEGRYFYLTDQSYSPNQALTACSAGYHMASLWEILDVSSLIYDFGHPAAHTKADSGYGPPSNWHGWVRTGYDSSGSSTTGSGNCLSWTSNDPAQYGVSVRLSINWETAPGDIFAWDANSFPCNFTGPVWCVGDFKTFYWPIFMPAIQNQNKK
jgi:hypothetical protein